MLNVPRGSNAGPSVSSRTGLPLAFLLLFIAKLPNWKFRLNNTHKKKQLWR